MKLDQFITLCEKAIGANFHSRNLRIFGSHMRHQRIRLQRRNQIRCWIDALRKAKDPATADQVARQVAFRVN